MLRSNHLQPGINLSPITFPNADLTLKVYNNTLIPVSNEGLLPYATPYCLGENSFPSTH